MSDNEENVEESAVKSTTPPAEDADPVVNDDMNEETEAEEPADVQKTDEPTPDVPDETDQNKQDDTEIKTEDVIQEKPGTLSDADRSSSTGSQGKRSRPGSALSGGNRAGSALSGGNRPDSALSGGNRPGSALSGGNRPGSALSGGSRPRSAMSGGSRPQSAASKGSRPRSAASGHRTTPKHTPSPVETPPPPVTEETADQMEGEMEADPKPSTAPTDTDAIPSRDEPALTTGTAPTDTDMVNTMSIPDAPELPSREETSSMLEGGMSNTALNIIWSFGLNRNIPVLNMTDGLRRQILYICAHVGVLYNFNNNKQHILQGHANSITCTCVSEDKHWLVTGDKGKDSMVIIWDAHTGIPVQTLFDPNPDGGVVAVAMTEDAKYLATMSSTKTQILSIWDWTVDGERPICTAQLNPSYGQQKYIYFNPEDPHYIVTNSDYQVVFYHWEDGHMEYFAPPLTDQDFNKPVGRYSQSIFHSNSSRSLTATSIGNLVVWDNNKPVTKVVSTELSADKKALKIIKLQDRGINVLTTTEKFIVVGDVAGHIKFFDQTLKLVNWYQDFHLGPINSISFAHAPNFTPLARENSQYPPDATISAKKFVIRDFVIGTSIAVFGHVTADGSKIEVIHREHDAAIHGIAAHPTQSLLAIGSYSGLLKIWDYSRKEVIVSRQFERGHLIQCVTYDPNGAFLAVGFFNGSIQILDALTLEDELRESFRYSRDAITHIAFSHDSQFMATADADFAVTVFRRQRGIDVQPFVYMGRYRAHYKVIKDIMFGIQLDSNFPRLLSVGEDRVLVEYDLQNKNELIIHSSDRIEQSAVPTCMTWYPPITKENFVHTANDQFKFKLYNSTTKMCRKTLLGPTYGSPIIRMSVIPTKDPIRDTRYLAYITKDKVGLHILPLDGNPHNAMALIAHPAQISDLVASHDGRYLFTSGGADSSVHMWEINISALEAQAKLGGEDLIPFYGLLEDGREGELFAELEDYFYYAQIRSQGVNSMGNRHVSTKIALTEVPFIMRAMGFYPSEQEVEDMLNEVKFSKYVETGEYVETIDLGDFIKLYINHRPAFGLSMEKLAAAFDTLGIPTDQGSGIERGELLDLLQSKGEHMTEYELAEYLMTLLGNNAEGGSSEQQEFDTSVAAEIIDENLPHIVTSDMFSRDLLGFSMYDETLAMKQSYSQLKTK